MDIEKIIGELPQASAKALKVRLSNVKQALVRNPEYSDAIRLGEAIRTELTQRKVANRIKVGPLWWEPADPDVPEFCAYDTADSLVPVATIFKNDTHTAIRKDVYSIRIRGVEISGRYAEVAKARQAGSEAWSERTKSSAV